MPKGPAPAPNPSVGNPIVLSTGAKLLNVEDFTTADGRFRIGRNYRSFLGGRALSIRRLPLGLAAGWQFDFATEVHLGSFSGSPSSPTGNVTLITPDGSGYDFVLQAGGSWQPRAASGAVSQDYRLEFVGTLPAALADIDNAQTEWRVTGPDDRTWTLKTFSDVNRPSVFNIGRTTQIRERDGYFQDLVYATDGSLASLSDSFGRTASFAWHNFYMTPLQNVAGALPFPEAIKEITFPDGTQATYLYDPAPAATAPSTAAIQRLVGVEWKDASGTVVDSVTYHYEDTDFPLALTGMTDHRSVRTATYAYDDIGRAVSTEGANGANKFTVAYATSGTQVTRAVTNVLGRTDIYKFNKVGSSTFDIRFAGVDGQASSNCPASANALTYNSNGYVASRTDEEGRITNYVNDSRGRPTVITQAAGRPEESQTTVTWHTTFNTPATIVAPGLTTAYTYNAAGQVTALTQTDTTAHTLPYATNGHTRTWSYAYDAAGLISSIDGPLAGSGDSVSYTYDAAGYVATFTDEAGNVTTVNAVNGRGQPIEIQDANGLVTELAYDARGRLTAKVDDPSDLASRTELEYDNAGNVTRLRTPDGALLTMEYDSNNRIISVVNGLGDTAAYAYDAMGNRTSEQRSNAYPELFFEHVQTFDELGRIMQVIGEGPATWAFGHDKVGNLTSVTDPNSNVAVSAYDGLNRLVAFTDERSSTTSLAYGATNDPATISDPRSVVTSYVRNGWGEAIQEQSNDIGTTVYLRNQNGQVVQRTDARGIVTSYTYDAAGRLASKAYPSEPASNVTYTYDSVAGGNAGKGRLTGVSDAAGTVAYSYDLLGRVIEETRAIAAQTYTVGYAWDDAGNLASVTYPSGRVVEFTRDAAGNVEQVHTRLNAGSPSLGLVWWIGYTPFGPRSGSVWANDLREWRGYDRDGRITSYALEDQAAGSDHFWRKLEYQDGRNLTLIDDQVNPAGDETYSYTANGFLQGAVGPWGTLTYHTDGVGNITHRITAIGGITSTDEYSIPGNSNRLTGIVTDGVPSRGFQSDWAGNIVEDATVTPPLTKTYAYNAAGQLAGAAQGGAPRGAYVYDYLSRLVSRTNHTVPVTLHLVHDLDGNVIAEFDSAGALITEYIWVDGRPLALVADAGTAPEIYFVHTDHLERPIMMTDASKAIVWAASYLPFGEVRTITGPAALNYRFPGQWFQLETGLHYNWHRHYDPSIGRYLQPDPLGMPDGPSRYAYVGNSPLMYVDPEGLVWRPGPGGGRFWCPDPFVPLGCTYFQPKPPAPNYCTPNDDNCDHLYYEVDIPMCRKIAKTRGPAAGARCYASAEERYAACLSGRPRPPLDTWNN